MEDTDLRRISPLWDKAKTMRRSGLPYGRIPQANRTMDKGTFAALERVLSFMCENLRNVTVPDPIDEDGRKVKQWIENYKH
jgi:hypothetical protein